MHPRARNISLIDWLYVSTGQRKSRKSCQGRAFPHSHSFYESLIACDIYAMKRLTIYMYAKITWSNMKLRECPVSTGRVTLPRQPYTFGGVSTYYRLNFSWMLFEIISDIQNTAPMFLFPMLQSCTIIGESQDILHFDTAAVHKQCNKYINTLSQCEPNLGRSRELLADTKTHSQNLACCIPHTYLVVAVKLFYFSIPVRISTSTSILRLPPCCLQAVSRLYLHSGNDTVRALLNKKIRYWSGNG